MKCNAQHLCPRCLVLKGDVPAIGTHVDMVHRSTTARVYPTTKIELAHRKLFEEGWSVSYKGKHDLLKTGSWVLTLVCLIPVAPLGIFTTPLQNAYHTELGLNPSELMSVDLMHDVELGLEKQVLLHHLRIFNAAGKGVVEEFDARSVLSGSPAWSPSLIIHRFNLVPTFGRDTIRRFGGNVSAFKRPAARTFEDILQVSLRVELGVV